VHPAVKCVLPVYVLLNQDVVLPILNVDLVLVLSVKMLVCLMLHVFRCLPLNVVILVKQALVQAWGLASIVVLTIPVSEIQPIVV